VCLYHKYLSLKIEQLLEVLDGIDEHPETKKIIKINKLFFNKKLIILKYSFIYQINLKDKQMSQLILVRHGQSIWNLEKKFTGWVDVNLTENGELEAKKAGDLIKKQKINIDLYYSSFQLRAKNTLKLIQKILQDKKISKEAWQLNERHYGALTGLNKDEMKAKLGENKVHQFRRSWDLRPDPLDKDNPYHPINIETYKKIPIDKIPDTESLKDTYERVLEFYKEEIENKITNNNILISAHGNSIRALCKYLFKLDNNQISKLEIPTGNPLLIDLDNDNKIIDCKYLDKERSKDLVVF
jgi:2,3-bisphosphoglycerate-dependent phosphoglycerate mutase